MTASSRPADFFLRNPVFRFDEFAAAHATGKRSPLTTTSLLKYHVAAGNLIHLRRGL